MSAACAYRGFSKLFCVGFSVPVIDFEFCRVLCFEKADLKPEAQMRCDGFAIFRLSRVECAIDTVYKSVILIAPI